MCPVEMVEISGLVESTGADCNAICVHLNTNIIS